MAINCPLNILNISFAMKFSVIEVFRIGRKNAKIEKYAKYKS